MRVMLIGASMIGLNTLRHLSGLASLVFALAAIFSSAALSEEARSVATWGAAAGADPQSPNPDHEPADLSPRYASDQILVKFKAHVAPSEAAQIHAQHGTTVVRTIQRLVMETVSLTEGLGVALRHPDLVDPLWLNDARFY